MNILSLNPWRVKRFTKQACRENVVASFFPLKIFIPLCFNILSTVPRENRLADSLYVFRLFHSTVLEEFRKNKETILSSLQACFVITNSSGDFIVKNICKHCLYTLHICITGIAVNLNALFNCYVKCGYQYTLHYEPLTTNIRKNRQRNHTLVQPLIQQKYLSAPILDTDSLP